MQPTEPGRRAFRAITCTIVALGLVAVSLTAVPAGVASAASASVSATADAYVSSTASATNYGSASTLRIDASPIVRSYVRFDLRSVTGTITSATLRLYAESSSSAGYAVATSSGAWTESTITYASAPAPGPTVATAGPFVSGTVASADVTRAVSAGSVVNLVVLGRNGTAVKFGSRESANPPVLELTVASPTPSPTSLPSGSLPSATVLPTPRPSSPATPSPTAGTTVTPAPTISPLPMPTASTTPSPNATPTPMPTPTPSPSPTPAPVSLRWGLIGNDGAHLATERGAGIDTRLLELSWSAYEPASGSFSASYVSAKKSELAALRSAGFNVILSLGVQYAPSWLLSYPNAYYVDQYGDAYNDTCSGCEIPNFVFNPTLRTLQDAYVARVFADFGTADFAAVRLGGGHYGELGYPAKSYGTNSNTYWAYDANAQASSPVPGWKPGMASPNGEASKFLNWYLDRLVDYETWQIATARKYYAGPLMMLFPSWGIRPGQADAAIAVNLNGTTSPEINGEVQRGYDFARQIAAIHDAGVYVDSTWLDCSYGNDASTSAADWRPIHYLTYLARQNPLRLRAYGENTGQGSASVMSFTEAQAKAYGLDGFVWFNEAELLSGQYATLSDYAALIATNP